LRIRRYFEARFCSPEQKPARENCLAPVGEVRGIFAAADAALLAQSQDNKVKSTEWGRRQAMWV